MTDEQKKFLASPELAYYIKNLVSNEFKRLQKELYERQIAALELRRNQYLELKRNKKNIPIWKRVFLIGYGKDWL